MQLKRFLLIPDLYLSWGEQDGGFKLVMHHVLFDSGLNPKLLN